MIDYRTAANADTSRSLMLLPVPPMTAWLLLVAGLVVSVSGCTFLWGSIGSSARDGGNYVIGAMAVGFLAMGLPLAIFCGRSLRKRIHFDLSEEQLEIEWRMGSRILRQTGLKREHVLDVQLIEQSPKSGKHAATYGLAILTPSGQVMLENASSSDRAFYLLQRAELKQFLQIE
jgi:hypothetical protein